MFEDLKLKIREHSPKDQKNPESSPTIPEFPQTIILLAVYAIFLIVTGVWFLIVNATP